MTTKNYTKKTALPEIPPEQTSPQGHTPQTLHADEVLGTHDNGMFLEPQGR